MSDEMLEKQVSEGQVLAGIALLLVALWGIYSFIDGSSASNTPTESNAPTSTNIQTIGDWKQSEDYEKLEAAEFFVDQHKSELAHPDEMRTTHNINMMKCLDQQAKSEANERNLNDIANLCIASINLKMATGK